MGVHFYSYANPAACWCYQVFQITFTTGLYFSSLLREVFFEIVSQKELPSDSITVILDEFTETFFSSEQLELIRKISTAALSADSKYLNYLSQIGCYTGLQNFKDIQFVVPSKSLSFSARR